MYHLVFLATYRRKILTERVTGILKALSLGIEKRFWISLDFHRDA